MVRSGLELRADADVRRVLIDDHGDVDDHGDGQQVDGVVYADADGVEQTVRAEIVVVSAGAMGTPGILLRSGFRDSASSRLIGRNPGFHVARLVEGLFEDVQDAHAVYPITAHCMSSSTTLTEASSWKRRPESSPTNSPRTSRCL